VTFRDPKKSVDEIDYGRFEIAANFELRTVNLGL